MRACARDSNAWRPWATPLWAALCAVSLTACGTDVPWLLKRDSLLVGRADKIATQAEAIDPDLTTAMYDAEDAKRAACQTLYASVTELMRRPQTFGEELYSDLGQFIAYFIPIDELERCAAAQDAYADTVEDLRVRIADKGTPAGD